jgi:hypothetical protein
MLKDWTDRPIKEMVKNGVEYLGKVMPHWRSELDWGRLRMDDPDCCIIGQLFCGFSGDYQRFHESKPHNWLIDNGFAAGSHPYDDLQKEWETYNS